MTEQASVLEKDVLKLPTADRARLAEVLLSSLDQPDQSLDELWAAEADSRVQAYERGELKAVPVADVFGKYDSK